MTLQEFLSRCSELQGSHNPAAGLVACEELLASGARGRQRAHALRYKAVFLLMSSQGWAREAIALLKEALGLLQNYPAEQAPVLSTLVAAYAMYGGFEMAHMYAAQFFDKASEDPGQDIRKYIPKVWFNLGYAYDAAGQYARAAEAYSNAYDEALKEPQMLNPGMAAHNAVQMYLELGRVDDALAMLQASQEHLNADAVGSLMKNQEALCLLALGRLDEAAAACREALAHPVCPERVRAEATFTQARLAAAMGQALECKTLSNQALDTAIRLPHPRLCHKITVFLTGA